MYCPIPPSYLVSVQDGKDEYMIGIFCEKHKREIVLKPDFVVQGRIIEKHHLKTEKLRSVSTSCVRSSIGEVRKASQP